MCGQLRLQTAERVGERGGASPVSSCTGNTWPDARGNSAGATGRRVRGSSPDGGRSLGARPTPTRKGNSRRSWGPESTTEKTGLEEHARSDVTVEVVRRSRPACGGPHSGTGAWRARQDSGSRLYCPCGPSGPRVHLVSPSSRQSPCGFPWRKRKLSSGRPAVAPALSTARGGAESDPGPCAHLGPGAASGSRG